MALASSRPPARTGVVELSSSLSTSGYCQNRLPSAGLNDARPLAVKNTTCRDAPSPKTIGDEYEAGASRAFQATSPVSLSKATTDAPLPPTLTSTRPPSTSGEQAAPKTSLGGEN